MSRLFSKEQARKFFGHLWRLFIWMMWDFSGVRFICRKIFPLSVDEEQEGNYRKPSTFFLWLIAVYVASYSLALSKHEKKLNEVRHEANILASQLSTPQYKKALSRVGHIQNIKCPIPPKFLQPTTIFTSIIGKEDYCYSVGRNLLRLVADWKGQLDGVDLNNAKLPWALLSESNLSGAKLVSANLKRAGLSGADLSRANLTGANLTKASLGGANLRGANLRSANFTRASLTGADLTKAKLDWGTNFSEARLDGVTFPTFQLYGDVNLQGARLAFVTFEDIDHALEERRERGSMMPYLKNIPFNELNITILPSENMPERYKDIYDGNISYVVNKYEQVELSDWHLKLMIMHKLSSTRTLYRAKGLDPEIEEMLINSHPHLFEEPTQ